MGRYVTSGSDSIGVSAQSLTWCQVAAAEREDRSHVGGGGFWLGEYSGKGAWNGGSTRVLAEFGWPIPVTLSMGLLGAGGPANSRVDALAQPPDIVPNTPSERIPLWAVTAFRDRGILTVSITG